MTEWNKIWKDKKYPMWIENDELTSYWDKVAAQRFQRLSQNANALELRKQIENLDLRQTDIVLDIGCGTGRLTIPIAKRVRAVYGIDISKEMLKIVKEESDKEGIHNIKLINANFETFDILKIGKVDVSMSYNSLGVYNIRKVLTRINNITKREVFIFTFAGKGEWLDERLAEIMYGEQIKNIPTSAEIIYYLLKEMKINPDFEIRHTTWKREYDNIADIVKDISGFYRIKDHLKDKVRKFVEENCRHKGKKCILFQRRDIAKIHWRVKNGRTL